MCVLQTGEDVLSSAPNISLEKPPADLIISKTISQNITGVLPCENTSSCIPSVSSFVMEYNPLFHGISAVTDLDIRSSLTLNPLDLATHPPLQQTATSLPSHSNPNPNSTLNTSRSDPPSPRSHSAPTSPSTRLTYQPSPSPTALKPQPQPFLTSNPYPACQTLQLISNTSCPLSISSSRIVSGLQHSFGPVPNFLIDSPYDKSFSLDLIEAQLTILLQPSSFQHTTRPSTDSLQQLTEDNNSKSRAKFLQVGQFGTDNRQLIVDQIPKSGAPVHEGCPYDQLQTEACTLGGFGNCFNAARTNTISEQPSGAVLFPTQLNSATVHNLEDILSVQENLVSLGEPESCLMPVFPSIFESLGRYEHEMLAATGSPGKGTIAQRSATALFSTAGITGAALKVCSTSGVAGNKNEDKTNSVGDSLISFLDKLKAPTSFRGPVAFDLSKMTPLGSVDKSKGTPVIHFSNSDVDLLAGRMGLALVGKFSHAILSTTMIDKSLSGMGFLGDMNWKYLNATHILIRVSSEIGLC